MTDDDEARTGGAPAGARLLREVVEAAPMALLQIDAVGVVRLAAGIALQVPPEQLVGCAVADLAESQDQVEWVQRALAGEHLRTLTRWGGKSWQAQYVPLRHDGKVTGVAAVFTEVPGQAVGLSGSLCKGLTV